MLRYYRRQNGDWSHIREAEVDVSLVKDEYILAGKVDLIRGEGNTVEIVDFKSERKPDVNDLNDRERIDRYRRQLEIYAHIVEERTGLPVSRSHIYYTREEDGLPTITFPRTTGRSIARLRPWTQSCTALREKTSASPGGRRGSARSATCAPIAMRRIGSF